MNVLTFEGSFECLKGKSHIRIISYKKKVINYYAHAHLADRVALLNAKLMIAVLEDQGQGSSSCRILTDVWKHFEKSGTKSVLCRLCNKEDAYLGGASNLQLFS